MQSYIQNTSDLPPELCAKPLALVGVSGLDTLNNAVHKSIWETFSNNRRADRSPVFFKLISNAHEFPVIKPKRNSYDWYIPKGILKRNWMNKHLYEIPAVIVIFYDLDWNDSLWNEKMIECASRVQSLRAALEGRNTRIAVVLIQNTLPLPPGEDVLASDRAVSLCASCELNASSLFVLPHGDHLQGYAVRLESAFYEFAQSYYHNEIKTIRSHKEHLNKSSHQYLFVRHQFKMGFLYELKQDVHTAHKHYTHAYNYLLEIRVVDTNALEIRTVAGFINYKLCKLMFALNLPRDAISQFKAHIDRFKNRMGFHELSFEHYAWLSKQFSVFGDIFDEAVKLGLPAVQTQHPGIYYQQAAQYAILRKKSCQELCSNIIALPQPHPLEGANSMEFYGQRPWRPGKLSAEPPDPQLESNGIQAIQYLEKQFAHSNAIVSLYGLAISQYKTYRCPRTRRHLVLQMAEEYYNSHDFGKALTLLTHMLWDFRAENWWLLLTDILEKAIRCAYLTASVQDYVLLSLEILGKYSKLSVEQKKRIHENLQRILKRQIPFGDQKLTPDVLQHAVIQWQPKLQTEPIHLSLDLGNVSTCIETKATFMQAKYEVDQNVTVEVYIKCSSPLPLTFTKVSVTINTPSYNCEYAVDNQNLSSNSLEFGSDETKRFVIDFVPDSNDVNSEIQIGAINLVMGNASETNLDLKFSPQNGPNRVCPELLHFKYSPHKLNFDNISPRTATLIIPRHSKLEIGLEYAIPALLGEWFAIKIAINNEELHDIKDMRVEVALSKDETISLTEFSTNSSGVPEKLPLVVKLPPTLRQGEKCSGCFYLRAHKVVENHIEVKISYTLDREKPVVSIKTETIIVPVVKPFEISTKFQSSLMEEIGQFYVGEEVGVMCSVRCLSPWPLIIENTSFEFTSPCKSTENSIVSHLANTRLEDKEVGVELFLAVCEKSSDSNVTVGQYMVKWRRENGLSTTSQLTIIGHTCHWIPLELKMSVPAHGFVRTPLLIDYHLHNRSRQLLQLDVAMEGSEAFMYAGYKQFSVSVLPESVKSIQYNLYPLIAGSVALPKLVLTLPENSGEVPGLRQEQLKSLVERCLPTHLYVMPQVKGAPQLPGLVKPRRLAKIK
ncbi:Trafficking protein particle complex subunit 11-like Protein [Tribolium castaneum]|uniref:Trafficking protein particle complex subunit 11-like Protein n=1 Tax=Tribolium castaneum TaxID=7070 RepID=D6WZH4_TRICA|nr:PREDICTED: trafficking protein particle complex subunit 11 isoform X1 [Tribolium castaneum]XP_971240.2 PREDICTED: trafficking protein particle complex subunit 11 isoform X1 [Tribolium castaneum]EFA10428.2 Trafficking protein particle complex subunit 11-like Protein [Tribolium castaneum]|eukprot:XP_015839078.1 PREDICTED: trafficking protein particle complex subunit 11 isoform X1 [Tribolium castaneum]